MYVSMYFKIMPKVVKYTCRQWCSGRERMGTAFPHKKLSGNGVPTREILRDSFHYCY